MKLLRWILWVCIVVGASVAAVEQTSHPAEQDPWTPGSANRTVVAEPNAVAKLAAALMNMTAPATQPAGHSKLHTDLQHQPGRLLVKFKELYGGNYSAVAERVNDWAGIDLIQVSTIPAPGSASSHSCFARIACLTNHERQTLTFTVLHLSSALWSVGTCPHDCTLHAHGC